MQVDEFPRCPWCMEAIKPEDNTVRSHGMTFHAGCAEELELENGAAE